MRLKVPLRRYFRFTFPCPHLAQAPTIDGDLSDWPAANRLPYWGHLEGQEPFAEVYLGWREAGLFVALSVPDKTRVRVDPQHVWEGDCLEVWIDTRNDKTRREFDEFCRQFYFLPRGGGPDGQGAVAGQAHPRGLKEPTRPHLPEADVASVVTDHGYALEAFLPASLLPGFAPQDHPEIGFTYHLNDVQKGQQALTVGKECAVERNPSLWATARLVGGA